MFSGYGVDDWNALANKVDMDMEQLAGRIAVINRGSCSNRVGTPSVVPAKAGTQALFVFPAQAGIQEDNNCR